VIENLLQEEINDEMDHYKREGGIKPVASMECLEMIKRAKWGSVGGDRRRRRLGSRRRR